MKFAAVILAWVIGWQSMLLPVGELMQLDELIEHAQYHNQKFGDNIFTFLAKHYGDLKVEHQKDHKEEKKDHEQLPFQHGEHATSLTVFTLPFEKITPSWLSTKIHIQRIFHYHFLYSPPESMGIFHPPKIV